MHAEHKDELVGQSTCIQITDYIRPSASLVRYMDTRILKILF